MFRISSQLNFRVVVFSVLISVTTSAQTEWNETEKRVANNIKTIITETCYQQFGKSDSCVATDISTYDRKGRLLQSISDPKGPYKTETTYDYDNRGNRTSYQAISRTDTFVVKDKYDANGNHMKRVSTRNGIVQESYSWVYSGKKLTSHVSTNNINGVTTREVRYTYDQNNNLISTTWKGGGADNIVTASYNEKHQRLIDSTKSLNGNVLSVTTYLYIEDTIASVHTSWTNGASTTTKFTYDALKRRTKIETIDSTQLYKYTSTEYIYDISGNMIARISTSGSHSDTTFFAYDNNENRVSQRSSRWRPEVIKRQYQYSDSGQLIKYAEIRMPRDTNSIFFEYDNEGRKIRSKQRMGQIFDITDYSYDANGFLINEKKSALLRDSMTLYYEIEYHNDEEGKHVEAIHKSYVLRNVLLREDPKYKSTPPSTFTMIYTYDERDSLLSTIGKDTNDTWSDQPRRYYYGENGKLSKGEIYYAGRNKLKSRAHYEYNDSGNVTLIENYLAGEDKPFDTYCFYYDSNGRLVHTLKYSVWGELIEHTINVYDEKGQLIKVVEGERVSTYRRYSYERY